MRKVVISALALLLIISCVHTAPDMFPQWEGLDAFERRWYSKHLRAAGEKPVSQPIAAAVYRFTWLRSFHNPIIIRIECTNSCVLTLKKLSGAGGYNPGRVSMHLTRTLSPEEGRRLEQLFSNIDFWAGPPEDDRIGLDGAQWILEAAEPDAYNAWSMWSPIGTAGLDGFMTFCEYLVRLADLDIPADERY